MERVTLFGLGARDIFNVNYRNKSKENLTFGKGIEWIYGLWRCKNDLS